MKKIIRGFANIIGRAKEEEKKEQLEKTLSFAEYYGGLMAFLIFESKEYSKEQTLEAAAQKFYGDLPEFKPYLTKKLVLSIGELIEKYKGLPEVVKEALGDKFHRDLKNIKRYSPKGSELRKITSEFLNEDTRYPHIF